MSYKPAVVKAQRKSKHDLLDLARKNFMEIALRKGLSEEDRRQLGIFLRIISSLAKVEAKELSAKYGIPIS